MRAGTWDGAVSTDTARVTVNDVVRPVESVQVRSGMRDGHPASPGRNSWCVTATIVWANPKDVSADSPSPFGGASSWAPEPGDTVVIESGDGALGQWWVQHTGVIDTTTGSIADGTAESRTIDMVDELNGHITEAALLSSMSPTADSTPNRQIGLQSCYGVDRYLRRTQGGEWGQYGWGTTPLRTWQTIASVPNMGSLWPDVGVLDASPSLPSWWSTPYGTAPTNYTADYRLSASTDEGVVTAYIGGGGTGSGTSTILLHDDAGNGFILGRDHATDEVFFGIKTDAMYVDRLPRNGADRIALRFKAGVSNDQIVDYAVSDGRTGLRNFTSAALNAFSDNEVRVDVPDGTRLGWWMVESAKPSDQWWNVLNSTQSARIRLGSSPQWWDASRDIQFTEAATLLDDQLTAECATAWLDEDGVFQWAGRGVLEAQPVAQTVTSSLDLQEIHWESRRSSMARGVWVDYETPNIELGELTSRDLWETGSFDLAAGEAEVATISVPGDEDWIDVDLEPRFITTATGGWASYATKSSYAGMQYDRSTGESDTWALYVDCAMTRENLRTYQISYSPWSTMDPAANVKAVYPKSATGHAKNYADAAVKLRGRGRVKWVERVSSAVAGTIGPSRYSHSAGWRVQDSSAIDDLIAFLADVVASTNPNATGFVLAHDPRRQIGDKVRVEDRHVTGTWIDVLVQDKDSDLDEMTDSITGRITAWGQIPDLSLQQPAGHTALTPTTDWNRS